MSANQSVKEGAKQLLKVLERFPDERIKHLVSFKQLQMDRFRYLSGEKAATGTDSTATSKGPTIADIKNIINRTSGPLGLQKDLLKKMQSITPVSYTHLDVYKRQVQGNYEFNQYRLKYFKSMGFVKESMIPGQGGKEDADGDIDMEKEGTSNENKEASSDIEDDNGVATGEADDLALEDEEAENYDKVMVTAGGEEEENMQGEVDAGEDEGKPVFDVSEASFQEIMQHIAKFDPESALKLQRTLDGLVQETKLSEGL